MTILNDHPTHLVDVEPDELESQDVEALPTEAEDEPQRPETDQAAPGTDPAAAESGIDHTALRIGVLRNQIDAIDDAIIRLINERVALSKNVGKLRRAGGGPRLSLTRENQIIGKFTRALGASGTPLAMLLLKVSRGRM